MMMVLAKRLRHLFGWRTPPTVGATVFGISVLSRDSIVIRTSLGLVPVSFGFVPGVWLGSDVEIAGWSVRVAYDGDKQMVLPDEIIKEIQDVLVSFFEHNGFKAHCTTTSDYRTWGRNPLESKGPGSEVSRQIDQ